MPFEISYTKCLMNLLIPMSDNVMCGLLVDSIPNSENKHQKNCTADSQENYYWDNERVNTIVSLSPLSSGLYSSLFYTRYAGKTSLAKMMVLFLLIGMVTKETHQVRVHSRPFPVYPGWQVQTYDPLVFVQVAFTFFFQALFSLLPN